MLSPHAIWGAVAIVVAVVGGVVALLVASKDPTPLLVIISVIAAPTVTGFIVRQKVTEVGTKVDGVMDKVNGQMTNLVAKIPDQP